MNILFITYHDFSSNSAIQIHNFANTLVKIGNKCCVAVPTNKESVKECIGDDIRYTPLNYTDLDKTKLFPDGNGPDIIHAWTPRENVRKQCMILLKKFICKLVIHLEDNEDLLLENALATSIESLKKNPSKKLNRLIPDTLSHPFFYKDFINRADGITVIMDKLTEFIPQDKEYLILWPGVDKSRFNPGTGNDDLKKELGLNKNELVLCYTGNVHGSNAKEVRSLYLAVALLNREGIPARLIRTGKDFTNFLGDNPEWAHKYSIEMGFIHHEKIADLLNITDCLIQPGKPDLFNEYRLPSKLPEFFIMGKPVILPKTNVGRFIQNHQEGLLLEKGDALDIVYKIKLIMADKDLNDRLSQGGHHFALKMFDLDTNTKKLNAFYKTILNSQKNNETSMSGHTPDNSQVYVNSILDDELSYATVRDFCDSIENFKDLCSLNGDLKNVQRPWIVKTIISNFPKGSKLLEIGAGEPKVADYLNKRGYNVTVIDPYNGDGNGPTEFDYFKKCYPNIRIIKNHFELCADLLKNESFDCIYSISVLEHVPDRQIPEIFSEIRQLLTPAGFSIHCIDHVLLGNGAEGHLAKLQIIANENDKLSELDSTITKLSNDVETYFLSAEGHLFWKGQVPYDKFPFRRVVSINIIKNWGNMLF